MKSIQTISVMLIVLFMSACSRYYYQPNSVNTPMLASKGDANVNLTGTFGSETIDNSNNKSSVINIQAGVSPAKGLGIIGGFTSYNYNYENEDRLMGKVDGRANLIEVGAGPYLNLTDPDLNYKIVFDTYAGGGFANIKSDVNMNMNRVFVQPGVNFKSKYFDAGLNLRVSGLKYTNFDANGHTDIYLAQQKLIDNGKRIDDRFYVFAEPALTLRGGYKSIKAQFQVVLAAPFVSVPWNYESNLFSLGLVFNASDLYKK